MIKTLFLQKCCFLLNKKFIVILNCFKKKFCLKNRRDLKCFYNIMFYEKIHFPMIANMIFEMIANMIFEMRTALDDALDIMGCVAVLPDRHGISRWPNGWTVGA